MQEIKKQIQKGLRSADEDDPFELFIASTDIRYTYYKDSHKILGNTFGMCVLQDFEALTPNLLARTIETVEGGGVIVVLLKTVSSLKQLYTMTMVLNSSSFLTARRMSILALELKHIKMLWVGSTSVSSLALVFVIIAS
jgi:N-acetyltransferase 10